MDFAQETGVFQDESGRNVVAIVAAAAVRDPDADGDHRSRLAIGGGRRCVVCVCMCEQVCMCVGVCVCPRPSQNYIMDMFINHRYQTTYSHTRAAGIT